MFDRRRFLAGLFGLPVVPLMLSEQETEDAMDFLDLGFEPTLETVETREHHYTVNFDTVMLQPEDRREGFLGKDVEIRVCRPVLVYRKTPDAKPVYYETGRVTADLRFGRLIGPAALVNEFLAAPLEQHPRPCMKLVSVGSLVWADTRFVDCIPTSYTGGAGSYGLATLENLTMIARLVSEEKQNKEEHRV